MSTQSALTLSDGDVGLPDEGSVLVVDPGPDLFETLVDTWVGAVPNLADPGLEDLRRGIDVDGYAGAVPRLDVLARRSVLDATLEEFHAASRVAALCEAGLVSVSTLSTSEPNTLLLTPERAAVVVDGPDGWFTVGRADAETARRMRETYDDRTAGSGYRLPAPSRVRIYDAFADRCSPDVATDLFRVLDAMATIRRHDPCDHLVTACLVAARHRVLNYDLRRAGEEASLASPSTFSNVKASLETDGLVDTEPVRNGVGRPRQRLVPGVDAVDRIPLDALPSLVADHRTTDRSRTV